MRRTLSEVAEMLNPSLSSFLMLRQGMDAEWEKHLCVRLGRHWYWSWRWVVELQGGDWVSREGTQESI